MNRSDSLQSVELPAEFFESESDEERPSDILQIIGRNPLENAESDPSVSAADAIVMNRSRVKLLSVMSHFASTSKQFNSISYDSWRMMQFTREFFVSFVHQLNARYPSSAFIPDKPGVIIYRNRMAELARDIDFENTNLTALLNLCSALYRQLHALCWPKQERPLHFEPQVGGADQIAESLETNLGYVEEGMGRNAMRMKIYKRYKSRLMVYVS